MGGMSSRDFGAGAQGVVVDRTFKPPPLAFLEGPLALLLLLLCCVFVDNSPSAFRFPAGADKDDEPNTFEDRACPPTLLFFAELLLLSGCGFAIKFSASRAITNAAMAARESRGALSLCRSGCQTQRVLWCFVVVLVFFLCQLARRINNHFT
eukprot:m.499720 g.499720  ORF g.499720 m.499720 type:complete len:152 (-) comp58496_c0_seq1:103-558(-)